MEDDLLRACLKSTIKSARKMTTEPTTISTTKSTTKLATKLSMRDAEDHILQQNIPKSSQSVGSMQEDLLRYARKSARKDAEDDLLRDCLKSTARTSPEKAHKLPTPSLAQSETSHKQQTALSAATTWAGSVLGKVAEKKAKRNSSGSMAIADAQNTDYAPVSTAVKSRVMSPELPFNSPAKNPQKRKLHSRDQAADLQEGDTLEADESDYDAQGARIEKPPTVKGTKKKKKTAKKDREADSPGQKELSNATLYSTSTIGKQRGAVNVSAPQLPSRGSSKHPFQTPMNCQAS
jgi:hypothetical protein